MKITLREVLDGQQVEIKVRYHGKSRWEALLTRHGSGYVGLINREKVSWLSAELVTVVGDDPNSAVEALMKKLPGHMLCYGPLGETSIG